MAAELGIDRYFAEVLPEEKASSLPNCKRKATRFVLSVMGSMIRLRSKQPTLRFRCVATTIATDMAEIVFMNGTLGQLPELFELADDFAANMRTNMLASVLPGAIGIAGTLLFGWGMGICVLLSQGSTPVGVYNAVKPMLDEQNHRANSVVCQ
ncbi:MAG: hypothetical protein R2911_34155 [Caldilineaceae bacterium]